MLLKRKKKLIVVTLINILEKTKLHNLWGKSYIHKQENNSAMWEDVSHSTESKDHTAQLIKI